MKFVVVGCGSIGKRHIKNLKDAGHSVAGCEKDGERRSEAARSYDIEVFPTLDKALRKTYDAAFICTPTSLHIPMALKVAERGIHLFIEKPLSNSLKDVEKLISLAKRKRLITFVGCNPRFLPSLKRTKDLIDRRRIGKVLSVRASRGFYLPYWHPKEDYRKEYSARKSLGGGVIFDDIHDIDILCWIFGRVREVFCFSGKLSSLQIDTEDIAEIFFKFSTGTLAQLHLDYLQRTYRSSYEFIGERGIIEWDYIKHTVRLYEEKTNEWKIFQGSIGETHSEAYSEEIKHFIRCIKRGEGTINDLAAAKRVLETALACHESSQRRKLIKI